MAPGRYSQHSMKLEFVDLVPGPRVIIQNQKFNLGLRVTIDDTMLSGPRKEVRLFIMFQGAEYAKMQKRITLRPTAKDPESNLILRNMTLDELPSSITKIPDVEIQFKVQIPLPGIKKEAISETFRLVKDEDYAKMYYDISDADILDEMNTAHHVESTEENTEDDEESWKRDFVERDLKIYRWAMKW